MVPPAHLVKRQHGREQLLVREQLPFRVELRRIGALSALGQRARALDQGVAGAVLGRVVWRGGVVVIRGQRAVLTVQSHLPRASACSAAAGARASREGAH